MYAVQGFLDGLHQQLDTVWRQQWDITWRNYVHEFFRDKNSPAQIRRRHLVLDLSREDEPVPVSKIHDISARIAQSYAKRTHKTLIRDLNAMRDAELLILNEKWYRAKKEIIFAFLPPRAADNAE